MIRSDTIFDTVLKELATIKTQLTAVQSQLDTQATSLLYLESSMKTVMDLLHRPIGITGEPSPPTTRTP